MTEWRDTTLGEVVQFQRGFDLTETLAHPGPYPVISSAGTTYTTDVRKVEGPGVVTGRKGVLGKVHYSTGPYWPHDTTLWVKDFKGSDPKFVYYLLQTLPLASLDAGASNPTLNRNHAHLLPVRVPPLDVQRRVATVLSALDDLIANCSSRVELLGEAAVTVFREWFLYYRYVGYDEAALTTATPDLMPETWACRSLGEVADWLSGGTPRTAEARYWGGDIPWITSGTLRSLLLDRSDRRVTSEGLQHGTRLVPRHTLLFVVRGMSLIKEFRVGIAEVPLAFGQDCKALVAKRGILPLFLAFAVISQAAEIQGMVELAGHGTGKLSTDRLKAIEIAAPPEVLQQRFVEAITPLREMMSRLRLLSDQLSAARDLLLPRLVTGQVDVSDLDFDAMTDSTA